MEESNIKDKIKNLKLTATRLALFERKLGTPLTKLGINDLGMNACVCLLEAGGLTPTDIDLAFEELGVEEFGKICSEALLSSGLFKKAKPAKTPVKAEEAKTDK